MSAVHSDESDNIFWFEFMNDDEILNLSFGSQKMNRKSNLFNFVAVYRMVVYLFQAKFWCFNNGLR